MDTLSSEALATLIAVINRIVPQDQDPAGTGFGADIYVRERLADPAENHAPAIAAGLLSLDAQSLDRFGLPFAGLGDDRKDALLTYAQAEHWFGHLTALVAEGVYADPGNNGDREARSWRMIGYWHGLPEGPTGPPKRALPPPRRLPIRSDAEDYDVIVVGAGASGGVAACVLTEAGKRVLLIERGHEHSYTDSGHRDHLRNHRHARYGHNTGPGLDGNPRVFVDPSGYESVVMPNEDGYHNIAAGVGSGTFVYGGLAWRFHPDDFRMASRYGVPDGSSLADWPIAYDELAPYYELAEWEIGVSGGGPANIHDGPRRRGYPMPPVPGYEAARVLRAGADRLGISTFTPPILINTVARAGRAACVECGSCVGFPCPSNAKNGTQNTVIPRALATGRCDLITGATVERVEVDDRGRVIGVRYVQPGKDIAPERTIRAGAVMLCCGAIETARLLLLSRSTHHPQGLGNANDLVGRNLQGHYYPTAYGLFDSEVHGDRGPGVSIATCDFNHGNAGVVGGGMLADDFIMLPVIFWEQALPPELPRWGKQAKDFMRDNFRRVTQIKGPVQEIPHPECRVTLDSAVRDQWGLAVARLSGTTHSETVRTARFMLGKARDWLGAAGATRIWGRDPVQRLSAGQHQAGTCRMGSDPKTSVTDSFGRVWGHDNLVVSDGSLHVTNGGFNPVLTIMALAFRNAEQLGKDI